MSSDDEKVRHLKLVSSVSVEVTPQVVADILERARVVLKENKILALAVVAIDYEHDPFIISRAEPHYRTALVGGLSYLQWLLNQEQCTDMEDRYPPKPDGDPK